MSKETREKFVLFSLEALKLQLDNFKSKTPYVKMNTEIIKKAFKYLGTKEFAGHSNNNPVIVEMLKKLLSWAREDEINWCSAFVKHVVAATGYECAKANAAARSWLRVGTAVRTPEIGDIVVFWRVSPQDWRGHVGFFLGENDSEIWVLGGNQNNQVNVKAYSKSRLLGYRRPLKIETI